MNITTQQLTKVYNRNVHALRGIDLTIPTGMFGLLGPNGAGKTTLMRILAGILHPTSGTLRVGDFDGTTERGRQSVKQILGYLPQELGMYPDLTARGFLDYIAILKGMDDATRRKRRIGELLELVSLADVANRQIKTYSGGMKRRVGIAQALLNDPRLLIVDEPTAGLDPEERIRFRNLLAQLGGDRVVLLSTHIVEDIAQTCQRLAVMKSGQIVFQGSLADLVQAAREHVWEIAAMPGSPPQGAFAVVSTVHRGATVHYRVVGNVTRQSGASAVDPGLEDAYVLLMRDHHDSDIARAGTLS
ncbi:MAG TPA: ABC transporter ATP-binding protein [Ktedonobacterales bacterium]|nr:ABC transporter ATP-binding protein [Ktedonobacterales bacterium]